MNFLDQIFLILIGVILGMLSSALGAYWQHRLELKRYEIQREDDLNRYEL